MSKVDSNFIKNLISKKYISNFKRITKRKFSYKNIKLEDGSILNGTYNWRSFKNDFNRFIYVIDDGEKVIYLGDKSSLPVSLFYISLSIIDDEPAFFITFKDNESFSCSGISEDNIHEDHIAGIVNLFNEYNIDIDCIMENMFNISYLENTKNPISYDNYEDFENKMKIIFKEIGFDYDKEMEDHLWEDEGSKEEYIKELFNINNFNLALGL